MPRHFLISLALVLGLAACDSAEERAERHFQSAEALAAAGDVDRALVELRNVFKYDGAHREARRRFAELQLARGEVADAYGNLLRLVEFHPDDLEARLALAELALAGGDLAEADRHGRAAAGLAPEAARVRAVVAALDHREALRRDDAAARARAADAARAALAELPGALPARVVLVEHLLLAGSEAEALEHLDIALEQAPDRRDLHELRLRVLARSGADDAAGAQLRRMAAQFPEDGALREAVVGWYVERERFAEAEAFLRAVAAAAPADLWPQLALAEVIRRAEGSEAARAALGRMVAEGGDALRLGQARAELALLDDDLEGAIAEMAALVEAAPEGAGRNDVEIRLAQLMQEAGRGEAAEARVAAVLRADPGHVEALKMEAARLIRADRPGDAVLALRQALARAPRDAAIMLLMAEAHLRDGSRDLAGERLALAVEVSGSGAREALRYAAFLTEQGRAAAAEAVLEQSLRANPADLRLVAALGELWLARGELPRVAAAVATLRPAGSPLAQRAADTLEAGLLLRQNRTAETLALLDGLVGEGAVDVATVGLVLQTHLAAGNLDAAEAHLERLMERAPEDAALRFLRAGLHIIAGEAAAAEGIYRRLIDADPQAEGPVVALQMLLRQDGRADEADAVLAAGLAAQPGSVRLRWMQASRLEAEGDTEGAIALYEALYAEDSSNAVFANNLASLLSTARSDAPSLEHAYAIARRLRSSDVPAFRDTYGWIEHRRGNHAEALRHLTVAAEGAPDSALIQFHLGMTLAALEREGEARAALVRALELGALPARQQAEAEAQVARLAPGPGQ